MCRQRNLPVRVLCGNGNGCSSTGFSMVSMLVMTLGSRCCSKGFPRTVPDGLRVPILLMQPSTDTFAKNQLPGKVSTCGKHASQLMTCADSSHYICRRVGRAGRQMEHRHRLVQTHVFAAALDVPPCKPARGPANGEHRMPGTMVTCASGAPHLNAADRFETAAREHLHALQQVQNALGFCAQEGVRANCHSIRDLHHRRVSGQRRYRFIRLRLNNAFTSELESSQAADWKPTGPHAAPRTPPCGS